MQVTNSDLEKFVAAAEMLSNALLNSPNKCTPMACTPNEKTHVLPSPTHIASPNHLTYSERMKAAEKLIENFIKGDEKDGAPLNSNTATILSKAKGLAKNLFSPQESHCKDKNVFGVKPFNPHEVPIWFPAVSHQSSYTMLICLRTSIMSS